MRIVSMIAAALLVSALTAHAQVAVPQPQQPQQPPPTTTTPQQPAPAPGAPGEQPPAVPGQPPGTVAPPQPAPTGPPPVVGPPVVAPPVTASRTFVAKTGMLFQSVRPERVVDFETVIGMLQEALEKSTDPAVQAQARGWRMFRATEPGPNATVLYVFVMDPAVPGADYGLGRILADAYPDKIQEIWKLYTGSLGPGATLLNLTPIEGGPIPTPPAVTPGAPTTTTPGAPPTTTAPGAPPTTTTPTAPAEALRPAPPPVGGGVTGP